MVVLAGESDGRDLHQEDRHDGARVQRYGSIIAAPSN
jgi:hypothetical protein